MSHASGRYVTTLRAGMSPRFGQVCHHASGRYVTMLRTSEEQFPDDEERDGPQNIDLLVMQPPEAADSPRIFG